MKAVHIAFQSQGSSRSSQRKRNVGVGGPTGLFKRLEPGRPAGHPTLIGKWNWTTDTAGLPSIAASVFEKPSKTEPEEKIDPNQLYTKISRLDLEAGGSPNEYIKNI